MESSTTNDSFPSNKENGPKKLDKEYYIYPHKKLGKGGFGQINLGENILTKEKVAIKIEFLVTRSHLYSEFEIMKDLQGYDGIPKIYKYIKAKENNFLIMELLGKSLEKIFSYYQRKFSIKTVIQIAYQMIEKIEFIHSKGYIHRDIKPGNFLIGKGDNKNKIYIIDFGLSKRYLDKSLRIHIPYKEGKGLTGTARYASLFTHFGIEQSRRDDIECIAFNLIYFAKGKLPWQGVHAKNKKEKHKKIMEKKVSMTPEDLCEGLPDEIPTLIKYARKLEFDEEPDYHNIKLMFQNLLIKLGYQKDPKFDWENDDNIDKENESEDSKNKDN